MPLADAKDFKRFYDNLYSGNANNKKMLKVISKRNANIKAFRELYPNEIVPEFYFFVDKRKDNTTYLYFSTDHKHYIGIRLYGVNDYQYIDKQALIRKSQENDTLKQRNESIVIKCLLKYIDLLGVSHTNTLYVYRVIYALTFIENIEGKEIHHINFNRKCNHPLNLIALTKQEHQAIHRQALEQINERLTAHNQKIITEAEMLDTSNNARWRKYPELYYIAENLQRENLEAPIPQDLNLIFANFLKNKENNIKWVA